jgi:hypothetical protein
MRWTLPTASMFRSGGVANHLWEASMGEVSTIGLDLAKSGPLSKYGKTEAK